MEDNIRQIVVQITSSRKVRGIVQYEMDEETDELPEQKIINFEDLTNQEKEVWDSFVNLLKNK